ncbi:MAG: DUF2029 domain-containing protein [Lachnospiraceae bacterium]|nr:DUF2029 domain-containing protein [Lachnospiraceae bacterium]
MTDKVYSFIKKNRVRAYLLIMLFLTLIFYATCLFDNSNLKSILFFSNTDTFMDFIHNISGFTGFDVYLWEIGSAYPAGAVLVFKTLRIAVMRDFIEDGSTPLREYQTALIVFFIYMAISAFIAGIAIQAKTKLDRFEKDVLYLIIMLSMPAVFALERGNIIVLAFALTFIYVAFSESEKKWVRAIAYIALGLAASIKIYPAIFGFYTLKKRGFKSALKLAVVGILIFYITFIPFGGTKAIEGFVRGTLFFTGSRVVENETSVIKEIVEDSVSYKEEVGSLVEKDSRLTLQMTDNEEHQVKNEEKSFLGGMFKTIEKGSLDMGTDYAYNLSFKNGWRLYENITGIKTSDRLRNAVMFLGIILVGLSAAMTKSSWKELLCYSILMVLAVPFSAPYTLLFLLIPFIYFLNDIIPDKDVSEGTDTGADNENKVYETVGWIIYGILFAAIIIPYVSGLSVPTFDKDGQVPLPYRTLINISLLLVMSVVLSVDGVREAVLKIQKRKSIKKAE